MTLFCGELWSTATTDVVLAPLIPLTCTVPPDDCTTCGVTIAFGPGFVTALTLYEGVPPLTPNVNVLPGHAVAVTVEGVITSAGATGGATGVAVPGLFTSDAVV